MESKRVVRWVTNPEDIKDEKVKSWAMMFLSRDSSELIANVRTECRVLSISDQWFFPVTINDEEYENSYVCSPYNALITYNKEEITRNIKSKLQRTILLGIVNRFDFWMKKRKINKVVHINNFLLSTNPYPDWKGEHIEELLQFLIKEHPQHTFILRSLNPLQHADLMKELQINDFKLGASRQVYMFMQSQNINRRNNKGNDRRIVNKMKYEQVGHDALGSKLREVKSLYDQLYLQKYSRHNPQFTDVYFKMAYEYGLINFAGYACDNRLISCIGLFEVENTITSPIVGYDMIYPKKSGLYIHAMHLIFKRRQDSGMDLNLSSGAAQFKRLRGGEPSIEYSAIYYDHLSRQRKRLWKVLLWIFNKVGVYYLRKNEF